MNRKNCSICGKFFKIKKFANKKTKYCSNKCKSKASYRRNHKNDSWKGTSICPYCGEAFEVTVHNKKFCKESHGKLYKLRDNQEAREERRKYNKEYRSRDPEKWRIYRNNKAFRYRVIKCKLKVDNWKKLLELSDNKCSKCGATDNLSIDHIIPWTKGGLNQIQNIQVLCLSCNASKKDSIVDYRSKEIRDFFADGANIL